MNQSPPNDAPITQAQRLAQLKQDGATPEQIKAEIKKIKADELALLEKQAGQAVASRVLSPESTNALVIQAFGSTVTQKYADHEQTQFELQQQIEALKGDSPLERAERLLISQAESLNAIFCEMSQRAAIKSSIREQESLMRLALKAQSQCRSTLDTLACLKQPSVIFAKTANIAQHQQVNQATNQQVCQPIAQQPDPHSHPSSVQPPIHGTASTVPAAISQQAQTALPIQTVLAESIPTGRVENAVNTSC